MNSEVENVFESYPPEFREPLLQIRQLVYDVADRVPGVGQIEESLKWGQPTYSTIKPKTGTPIRVDRFGDDQIALFFHCQTNLIENFRVMFKGALEFSKNRAIVLDPKKELPKDELSICVEKALIYHLQKSG